MITTIALMSFNVCYIPTCTTQTLTDKIYTFRAEPFMQLFHEHFQKLIINLKFIEKLKEIYFNARKFCFLTIILDLNESVIINGHFKFE